MTPLERLAAAIAADFEPEQIGDWQGDGSYAPLLSQRLAEKGLTICLVTPAVSGSIDESHIGPDGERVIDRMTLREVSAR